MWTSVASKLPDDGVIVETQVNDAQGVRNVQVLKRSGNLWFIPDGSMYVYYRPTHWRPLQGDAAREEARKLAEKANAMNEHATHLRRLAASIA